MDLRPHLDCAVCSLRESCTGAGISTSKTSKLESKEDRVYFRGETISEEENSRGVFLVKSGLLRVLRKLPSGVPVTIDLVTTGDMLAYPSLFSMKDSRRTIDVLDASEVCFIASDIFLEWIRSSEVARGRMVRWAGLEFLRREEQICSLSHRSVRERTAEALLYLAERFGLRHEEGMGIPTALTREDIASLIGTARESVVRQLAEFKEEGCITLDGRQIVVLRPDQLKQIAKVDNKADSCQFKSL